MAVTSEIKIVNKVIQESSSYLVECPHCNDLRYVEGDDMEEIRGEQYQMNCCGGWIEVSSRAARVK